MGGKPLHLLGKDETKGGTLARPQNCGWGAGLFLRET